MRMLTALVFVLTGLMTASGVARAASLETMAGQMVMVGFRGQSSTAAGVVAVRRALARGEIGGVMYLRGNVASLGKVRAMNVAFAAATPDLPPLIALDQEGGKIERLTRAVGFAEIPSAAQIAASRTPTDARQVYEQMAKQLAALGFTVNFGPVVDLNTNPDNPIIARYGRSYGAEPGAVTAYGAAFVVGHRAAGVLTALKHFPGHGSSAGDSHAGFVDISQSWQAIELAPFGALIDAGGADMVMMGHLFHRDYGSGAGERLPASLSPAWIGGVLRGKFGYDGVVITDDLEMGAIRKRFGLRETVVRAVLAGADILLFSNTADYRPGLGAEVRAILAEEAGKDPVFAARVKESYARIVRLKQNLRD